MVTIVNDLIGKERLFLAPNRKAFGTNVFEPSYLINLFDYILEIGRVRGINQIPLTIIIKIHEISRRIDGNRGPVIRSHIIGVVKIKGIVILRVVGFGIVQHGHVTTTFVANQEVDILIVIGIK